MNTGPSGKGNTETDQDNTPNAGDPLSSAEKTNYITPVGYRKMRDELEFLVKKERPEVVSVVSWAASNGDRSENGDYIYGKKRLREIDRRIRFLTKRTELARVVDPADQQGLEVVFFGATVTYVNSAGLENTIKIVGVDEVDTEKGNISWVSPVARALMKSKPGDVVELSTPAGHEELEVLAVSYPVARP